MLVIENVVAAALVKARPEPLALPMFGVVNVGDVAKTIDPLPVVPLLKSDAASCAHVMGDEPPPADRNTYPDVPAVVGRLKLYVPAAA